MGPECGATGNGNGYPIFASTFCARQFQIRFAASGWSRTAATVGQHGQQSTDRSQGGTHCPLLLLCAAFDSLRIARAVQAFAVVYQGLIAPESARVSASVSRWPTSSPPPSATLLVVVVLNGRLSTSVAKGRTWRSSARRGNLLPCTTRPCCPFMSTQVGNLEATVTHATYRAWHTAF